jgi:starch phosphorylase
MDVVPRTVIIGGKSAPGYFMAKLIIKLINSVADVVNNDPEIAGRLKVVFYPDFNVKNAHNIYPAADLSEQISTAGTEASGTGNMKFSMNGALTIGTLDGANIEIRNAVGIENFFSFGLTTEEIRVIKKNGHNPQYYLETNTELREVINAIDQGLFSNLFTSLVGSLRYHDHFMLLADYASYIACQDQVDNSYRNPADWTKKSILNVARIGKFSSDRSIKEYAEKIWKIKAVKI